MATLTEYKHVCNLPQTLNSSKVDMLETRGASMCIFRQSSTQDMRSSLQSSEEVMYVAHNVANLPEEKLIRLLEKAQGDSRNREVYDHVHNIRAKASETMFYDYINSVRSNLLPRYQPLLAAVNNFKDLNKIVSALHEDHGFHGALETASKPFCETYQAESGFWVQYADLEAINTDRNNVVHCSVAVSAAALSKAVSAAALSEACDKSDALDSALAMVEALANYCAKHAADLDASALKQRQQGLALTERVKQKNRTNKGMRK